MAKLYWSGEVGWVSSDGSGITIETVRQALEAANGQPINVELTTLGGDFFQAAPILNLLRNYTGQKTVWINGIVASAGTVIAIGFDKIIARTTSMFMIHNAQGLTYGDHNDMRDTADLQERMSDTIAAEYAKKTGKTIEQVKEWMDAKPNGTWFMGEEILQAGFATEMESDTQQKASTMMLITAQKQFQDFVTMLAKRKPDEQPDAKAMAEVDALIVSGAVDRGSSWAVVQGDKVVGLAADGSKEGFKFPAGKNGKVYRSALRSVAARAAGQGRPEIAAWAQAKIQEIDAKGEKQVNKDEIIAWLKLNPGVDIVELAASAGRTILLATPEHTAALAIQAKLAADLKVTDASAEIVSLRAKLEEVDVKAVSNILTEEFGPEKDANGVVNNLRTYAGKMLAGVKSADIAAKVEEFKKDPIALKLAGERMDANSDQNLFGRHEGGEDSKPGAWLKAPSMVL
jgi:ATP-dependent protease ClpP protease subunit